MLHIEHGLQAHAQFVCTAHAPCMQDKHSRLTAKEELACSSRLAAGDDATCMALPFSKAASSHVNILVI